MTDRFFTQKIRTLNEQANTIVAEGNGKLYESDIAGAEYSLGKLEGIIFAMETLSISATTIFKKQLKISNRRNR